MDKHADLITQNKNAYDKLASLYDDRHVEIFNPTEQKRIKHSLEQAFRQIATGSVVQRVLDFGAGTGNLTKYLLGLEADVTAADLSAGCLQQIGQKLHGSGKLTTLLLNGRDLSNIEDDAYDMVATYSVLHHIPDYLKLVDEFVRVTKPGGVVYIDHEVCPHYWEENADYQRYLNELGAGFSQKHLSELGIRSKNAGTWGERMKAFLHNVLLNLKLVSDEGDIHVHKHDHIEWEDIKMRLLQGCKVLLQNDYLVCRETDENPGVWTQWRDKVSDMRLIVARKVMDTR